MSTARVDWTVPANVLYTDYDIHVRAKGAREWDLRASTRATSVTLAFPDYGTFEIAIAPRVNNVPAAPTSWTVLTFVAGSKEDLTAPATPANFRASQDGNVVRCAWDAVDDSTVERYEVRAGGFWETGLVMATVPAGVTETSFAPWATGVLLLTLKAITKQGLESVDPATVPVTLTVTGDSYGPVQGTHDEQSAGFAGVKDAVETDGGDLVQSALPTKGSALTSPGSTYTYPMFGRYRNGGTYTTPWRDAGALVEERVEVAVGVDVDAVMPLGSQVPIAPRPTYITGVAVTPGTRSTFNYITGGGFLKDGVGLQVEIDTSQNATPTSDGWRRWVPGTVYTYREVRLRFTLSCPWAFARIRIPSMTWYRRRLNRKTEGSATVSGTGGTDISWAGTGFSTAPMVTGSVMHASNPYFVTFSNVTTTGAKVRIWDTAGAEVGSGAVHYLAMGV